jgi:hypothetical protein
MLQADAKAVLLQNMENLCGSAARRPVIHAF